MVTVQNITFLMLVRQYYSFWLADKLCWNNSLIQLERQDTTRQRTSLNDVFSVLPHHPYHGQDSSLLSQAAQFVLTRHKMACMNKHEQTRSRPRSPALDHFKATSIVKVKSMHLVATQPSIKTQQITNKWGLRTLWPLMLQNKNSWSNQMQPRHWLPHYIICEQKMIHSQPCTQMNVHCS